MFTCMLPFGIGVEGNTAGIVIFDSLVLFLCFAMYFFR